MSKDNAYHPSLEELIAYKKGELSPEKAKKIEQAVASNSMLSAVLAGIDSTDLKKIHKVTEKANEKLNLKNKTLPKKGLNVPLIFGIGFFLVSISGGLLLIYPTLIQDSPKVVTDGSGGVEKPTHNIQPKEIISDSIQYNQIQVETEVNKDKEQGSQDVSDVETQPRKAPIEKLPKNDLVVVEPHKYTLSYDSTEMFEQIEKMKTSIVDELNEERTNQMSFSSVSLMSKVSVVDRDKKNVGKTGKLFLESSIYDSKSSGKGEKDDKMPSFKGGDQELLNYFERNLSDLEVKNQEDYRKDFYLKFVIDNDGSLKTWKILGNIAPEVKAVVKEMIENVPQWNPSEYKGKRGELEYTFVIELSQVTP